MSAMETFLTTSPIGNQCTLFGTGCPDISLVVGILAAVLLVIAGTFGTLGVYRLIIGCRTRAVASRPTREEAES